MFSWQLADGYTIDDLVQVKLPTPDPGPGELLIRVERAALNFSDLLMIAGTYQVKPTRPFTPGQEVAGIVVAVGEGTSCAVGQRVASKVFWGGFAEFTIIRENMVILIPDRVSMSDAVVLPVVYTTAVIALQHCVQIKADDRVLIHASAGGVGLAAVQIAQHLGAKIFATAGSDYKCKVAQEHGAELVFNYLDEDWQSELMNATKGKGVNVVFDPVGGDVTQASLSCLAWQGQLLIVGFSSGNVPYIPAHRLLLKRASVVGVYWSHEKDQPLIGAIGRQLAKFCEAGVIQPVTQDHYGFSDLQQALRDLRDRSTAGKLVVKINDQ